MGTDVRMMVRTSRPVTADEVLEWAYQLSECFGEARFYIDSSKYHALELMTDQDDYETGAHPDLKFEKDRFIKVRLMGRYYARGYERGEFEIYNSIANWLWEVLPVDGVYYGGDSHTFLRDWDFSLWHYFCRYGHRPHYGMVEQVLGNNPKAPMCDVCRKPMVQLGFGQTKTFECLGCGQTFTE